MALRKIERVEGPAVHVPGEDVDTDRIIPARFLKSVTFDGLGEQLFYDVRFAPDGSSTGHPLDDPRFAQATVLIADRNFGCGSSREHAPQAIAKRGFQALVAESFAAIFFGNATTLGMPCVTLERSRLDELAARTGGRPETLVTVDLIEKVVRTDDGFRSMLSIPEGARQALVAGRWDPISELLEGREQARVLAGSLPYARLRPYA
ncbi:MAG TPA: 3-isopropylmalate dehydratase small subunit [Polyangiaceae bacterium]|jgi:3-isopropylmalate/(R)-2-methylmalate dehydratase small subunit|nr:3-isopropylmalate dehydratase small subunit [Polyangiaceae bacterium]